MLKSFLIFISIVGKLSSKEYVMKKSSKDNEFSPYIFKLEKENINNSFIFDTTSYILWLGNHNISNFTLKINTIDGEKMNAIEICNKNDFCYFKTDKIMKGGYIGSVGISNKNREILTNNKKKREYENKFQYYFLKYYLNTLNLKEEERYINFIQKNNNEAIMIFGNYDNIFKNNFHKCQCKKNQTNRNYIDNNIYWCCEISSIKIGENDIYNPIINNKYGIFSISEEYIIGPDIAILHKYQKYIKETFGVECQKDYNLLIGLKCDYFNYKEMPDLSFIMKEDFGILALSTDLFKVVGNNKLELKIKINNKTNERNWYLGEPIIKNYNLLLNYTNLTDISLIIIPSSRNSFIIITIIIILGFLFLIIFIIIMTCIYKKGKIKEKNTFFRNDNFKKDDKFFSFGKNSTIKNNYTELVEKIEEEEDEETEKKINDIKDNIKLVNNTGSGIINDSYIDKNSNRNNNNLETPISIEFSLKDIEEDFDDNDDLFKKK